MPLLMALALSPTITNPAQALSVTNLFNGTAVIRSVSPAEVITIDGTVRDAQGPLPGASILIKNSSKGTTSDAQGKFSL